MKRECILSDKELTKKRKIIQKNKLKKILNEQNEMTTEEIDIMEQVVSAYNFVEKNLGEHGFRNSEEMPSYIKSILQESKGNDVSQFIRNIETRLKGLVLVYVKNRRTGDRDASTVNVNYIKHFSDIMNLGLCQLINFSKQITEFSMVDQNDQVALIRSASAEVVILQAATYFDTSKSSFVSPDSHLEYGSEELREVGFTEPFLEKLKIFLHKFTQLDLSKEEFVLTVIIVVFSPDRRGLQNSSIINKVQENYATLLERAMISPMTKAKYGRNRFPDIISLISELRILSFLAQPLGKALHDQMAEDVLPPLLKEMIG